MARPKAILFDLGGVLINFVGLDEMQKLLPEAIDPAQLRANWIASPAISAFERGELSPQDFSSQFVGEWELNLSAAQFLEAFTSWITGPFTDTETLLRDLYPHYTLACLSNTNEVHWDSLLADFGMGELLHRQYASHIIGEVKPAPKAFEYACRDLDLEPNEIIFFDDGEDNINGARQFGLSAYKVHGPQDIRKKLDDLDLIGLA